MSATLEPSSGRGRYVDLSWSQSGSGRSKAERSPHRYRAWVPDRVAGYDPRLGASTAAVCERAGAALQRLNFERSALLALEGMGRQLLRSESLASSQIEGLSISHRKLAEAEFAELANYRALEIVGTIRAMERALAIGAG